jgi:G:T-mismatch repair DNA endonuclease (very short patch repair protein)
VIFWNQKLDANIARDQRNESALRAAGWKVFVIWECTIDIGIRKLGRHLERAAKRLAREA